MFFLAPSGKDRVVKTIDDFAKISHLRHDRVLRGNGRVAGCNILVKDNKWWCSDAALTIIPYFTTAGDLIK